MRAPYQTLTILYKKENKQIKFAIFYRNSHPIWQFVSGGGEDNETPIETVVREIKEELGMSVKKLKYNKSEYFPQNEYTDAQFRRYCRRDFFRRHCAG